MKKSIVALLISAGVLTGCAQNNATESVAETVVETATAAVIETATETATEVAETSSEAETSTEVETSSEAVATLAEKVDEATEEAFYNYVFGSGNYEPRDADALGTAVAKYVMDDVIISIIDDYDHVYECDVESTKGEIIKVYCDDEGAWCVTPEERETYFRQVADKFLADYNIDLPSYIIEGVHYWDNGIYRFEIWADEANYGLGVDLNGNINYIEDKVSGDIWYDEGH